MNKNKISWYIGHMKKTVEVLELQQKKIDFVIEVVDARLPTKSSNNEILKIFNNKPIIKVAVKADLIDSKNKLKDLFYLSTKNYQDKNKTINFIQKQLQEKINKLVAKGLLNPILIGIVIGLPNIGKSSFINFLGKKNNLNVENRPGVTRKIENVKISDQLYLIDTPGVFFKNIEDINVGYDLALINCVNRNIIEAKTLLLHLLNILIVQNKLDLLNIYFGFNALSNDPNLILEELIVFKKIDADDQSQLDNFYNFVINKIVSEPNSKLFLEK
ncbi:MAG: ribosome biogenesis GTPase YlqF [Malacoplasma sp.]|mgnify:CR=1 FL=1|nr:ribosome biogenesis GTPase YlqF [Malacoplasma sp.]